MSQIEVDKVIPQSGTALQVGDSGDTITIPAGATITNNGTANGFGSADTEKVKVSSNDTTAGFLNGKLVAGTNISLTEGSDGGNETLTAALTGTIGTSQIADDAVTLAKMAPGTDGNIISYDASGNPVAVATGSAGQVLTSAGAGAPPTFATASGGCWEKLDTITISGTTSQLEHEEANFTSTHRDYKIMLSGILVSADSLMLMRIAGDGASLETTNNYRYANTSYKSNNAVNNQYNHGTNRFILGGTDTGTSSALYTTSFEINIYNPLSTSSYKSFSSFGFHNDDNDYAMTHVSAGIYTSAQATAMKRWVLFMNSGDFTGGTSTLYGRAI